MSSAAISSLSLHDALPISTAAPSLRNSGLLATSKKWEADGEDLLAKRSTNARLVPTGTVLFMTIMGLAALVVGQEPLSRSEEHTSELQSHHDLVCRLLLEK